MAAALTQEQEQIIKHFIEEVNLMRKERGEGPVSWSTAVKFLCARKFDVARAVALHDQHEATRHREGLLNFDPSIEPLKSELDTAKFTILPTRDATGAAIAVFTARIHSPQISTHQTTLQGIVYQLDVALESIETQKAGLVFIYDMSDSKYSNFDYDLSKKILMLLKGGYPAKLKKVLIVTAPLWFKAPFKILRLFVREKLRDRVYTVSIPQLALHIPRESLPVHLGGTLEVAHEEWLLHCFKTVANKKNEENGMETAPAPATNGNAFETEINAKCTEPLSDHPHLIENEGEEQRKTGNKHSQGWQCSSSNLEGETSPQPAALSSASSGFSDDDSLHCDSSQGLNIEQFIETVIENGRNGLTNEYLEIKSRPPDGTFNDARQRSNQSKNRYTDVLCYDHSRVILSQIGDDISSTYINANFVDGYKQKNAFISTQGPLPKTCADFWRMVWEQHVLVIVMTTRVLERGRVKCAQYWPEEDISEELIFAQFRITNDSVEKFNDYTITGLQITNLETEETREVTHYLFTSWPDYGVPQRAVAMLDFLNKVRQGQADMLKDLGDKWAGHPRGPPIVVHCSAGIGRTGTFCTLDICISRLEDVGLIDIRNTVEKIRSQRAFSIQMPEQYIFCHLALIEYAFHKKLISTLPDLSSFDMSHSDDSD
ncbi:tyrosine-protein phosphatase non-receptor type 9 [Planococcus citri]|uniref:tyrosine-protein phosphatase non-receptor type 9 n=1 Tax=Planococcus citri TaxID=170843 RepID=UPI0031F7C560